MQQIIVLIQANWCIYPSSEPPFGGPPSPRGEGLGAAIIGAINYNLKYIEKGRGISRALIAFYSSISWETGVTTGRPSEFSRGVSPPA